MTCLSPHLPCCPEEILEDGHHGPASYRTFLQGSDCMHQHALLSANKTHSREQWKQEESFQESYQLSIYSTVL